MSEVFHSDDNGSGQFGEGGGPPVMPPMYKPFPRPGRRVGKPSVPSVQMPVPKLPYAPPAR